MDIESGGKTVRKFQRQLQGQLRLRVPGTCHGLRERVFGDAVAAACTPPFDQRGESFGLLFFGSNSWFSFNAEGLKNEH